MLGMLLDGNLVILWVSRVIPQLRVSDVIGRHPWDFNPPDEADVIKTRLSRCIALGERQVYRSESQVKGARHIWQVVAERIDSTRQVVCMSRELPQGIDTLSEVDRSILGLLAKGRSQRAIADSLGLGQSTVSKHVERMILTCGMVSRDALARVAASLE